MRRIQRLAITVFLLATATAPRLSRAAESAPLPTGDAVALGDSVGTEISRAERDAYGLFPDVEGFDSATVHRTGGRSFRVRIETKDATGTHTRTRRVSAEAFDLTRQHIAFAEEYRRRAARSPSSAILEPEAIEHLALRYASRGRYDVAATLAEDLATLPSEGPESRWAAEALPRMRLIERNRRVLFREGALADQGGRRDLLLFSGYYGVWLGIATPVALDASSPQAIAAGLLIGGPGSIYLAHVLTKDADFGVGRASMVALGGNLGTWQGLGWGSFAGSDFEDDHRRQIALGEVVGLAGIAGSVLLTRSVYFSEGHAEITGAGMPWGAWFGLVGAILAEGKDEEGGSNDARLRAMLIGSDVGVLGAGIATRNVHVSRSRVRLVNLAGVLGGVVGGGVDLLFEIDDKRAAIAIGGIGTIAGLAVGAAATKNLDRGRDFSESTPGSSAFGRDLSARVPPARFGPELRLRRDPGGSGGLQPALALSAQF